MKSMITVICLWLSVTASAQFNDDNRIANINPLRNGDGSFMRANNPLYYNNSSADTIWTKKKAPVISSRNGDPLAFRIHSLQVLCDQNSVQLNWTGMQQQADADYFDIEESDDGGVTWNSIGILPAARSKIGQVPYNFVYNKTLGNVDLRVAAVNTAGERRYSSIAHSACSINNLFSVDNLVYNNANIRIGSPGVQNIRMLLANQSGRVLLEKQAGLTQGINSINLNMSNLPKGFYVLTVVWPGGRQESAKIMKQ